jgi:hypothetical protein
MGDDSWRSWIQHSTHSHALSVFWTQQSSDCVMSCLQIVLPLSCWWAGRAGVYMGVCVFFVKYINSLHCSDRLAAACLAKADRECYGPKWHQHCAANAISNTLCQVSPVLFSHIEHVKSLVIRSIRLTIYIK